LIGTRSVAVDGDGEGVDAELRHLSLLSARGDW
jgi:hypothetical protein